MSLWFTNNVMNPFYGCVLKTSPLRGEAHEMVATAHREPESFTDAMARFVDEYPRSAEANAADLVFVVIEPAG